MANLNHKHGRPFKGLRCANPALRKRFDHGEPISKIDTRPMVFVALFLAIMVFLGAAQIRPHAFNIDLWDGKSANALLAGSIDAGPDGPEVPINRVTISQDDQMFWNGHPIREADFSILLREVKTFDEQPTIDFAPAANASYDATVKALYLLRLRGVRFQISGLEEHCRFTHEWGGAASNQDSSLNVALSIFVPERAYENTPVPYYSIPEGGPCKERFVVQAPN